MIVCVRVKTNRLNRNLLTKIYDWFPSCSEKEMEEIKTGF